MVWVNKNAFQLQMKVNKEIVQYVIILLFNENFVKF